MSTDLQKVCLMQNVLEPELCHRRSYDEGRGGGDVEYKEGLGSFHMHHRSAVLFPLPVPRLAGWLAGQPTLIYNGHRSSEAFCHIL
jgi:hypothetical protein